MYKNTKFYLLFCALFALSVAVSAQSRGRAIHGKPAFLPAKFLKNIPAPQDLTGLENVGATQPLPSVPAAKVDFRGGGVDEYVGETIYDLQSNGTESARLHEWPNGEITGTWVTSTINETAGYTDRGTGYNKRSDWNNNVVKTARIEASTRTGFNNYVVTASGVELVFSHKAAAANLGYRLHLMRRAPGATAWTEGTVPTAVPKGQLWCKAAVDGENVYVIALSTPIGTNLNGGEAYKGMNGHVLFWCSKDAGLTWDIQDGIIPGFDQTAFAAVTAEGYAIDARDGMVAVASFDSWNDTKIWKSSNNGTTWEDPLIVLDFPLEKYVADAGYSLADIGGVDPDGPGANNATPSLSDSLAIFTNDGSGALLIDNIGQVHIWFGRMFVTDDPATAGANYYPSINALLYWNENRATDDFVLAGDIIDANGNGTIDNLNLGVAGTTSTAYGCGISSMATAGQDANGVLYIAYSALSDSLVTQDGLSYRHIVTSRSLDNGDTWEPAVDVHYSFTDIVLADFQEGVFPFCLKRVKKDFQFVCEIDNRPGCGVLEAGIQDDISTQVFISKTLISTPQVEKNGFNIAISPNPTNGFARMVFTSERSADASVQVMNTLGAVVSTKNFRAVQGQNTFNLDAANLEDGIYFIRLNVEDQFVVKKLMVSKK